MFLLDIAAVLTNATSDLLSNLALTWWSNRHWCEVGCEVGVQRVTFWSNFYGSCGLPLFLHLSFMHCDNLDVFLMESCVIVQSMMCSEFPGNRGCWFGPEDKNGSRTWWSCDALCTWSEWKSRYPEVHWMCSWRKYPLYCVNILWSSCDSFYSSIRVPCYTGYILSFASSKDIFEVLFFPCLILWYEN